MPFASPEIPPGSFCDFASRTRLLLEAFRLAVWKPGNPSRAAFAILLAAPGPARGLQACRLPARKSVRAAFAILASRTRPLLEAFRLARLPARKSLRAAFAIAGSRTRPLLEAFRLAVCQPGNPSGQLLRFCTRHQALARGLADLPLASPEIPPGSFCDFASRTRPLLEAFRLAVCQPGNPSGQLLRFWKPHQAFARGLQACRLPARKSRTGSFCDFGSRTRPLLEAFRLAVCQLGNPSGQLLRFCKPHQVLARGLQACRLPARKSLRAAFAILQAAPGPC